MMPETNEIPDQYLGDGVWASFDGCQIILDLRDQDNYTVIGLEPNVMRSLKEYDRNIMIVMQKLGES